MFFVEENKQKPKSSSVVRRDVWAIDTVQDCLVKLGIKPYMHLWEMSIFSLNNVLVRPTKL